MLWDVFISHASEDKSAVATPLADALTRRGLKVWLDEGELTLGDSLREKIDHGLANARFGVVVLSPRFFAKDWPQRELNGLFAREIDEVKVILPVWHEVDRSDIARHSPMLADRIGAKTSAGLDSVAALIVDAVMSGNRSQDLPETLPSHAAVSTVHMIRQNDLLIDVGCKEHCFAVCILNEDTHPVSDCRVTLERLDRFLPKKAEFAVNSFEPMTLIHARSIRGGDPSDGFAFATWDTAYRTIKFQSGIPEQRRSLNPEITAEGMWIAEFQLNCGGRMVGREARFFQFTPGAKPSLILDPRTAASYLRSPENRFAHLKSRRVKVTPVLPLHLADEEYFVRNVTEDEIELERSGFSVSLPAQKVVGEFAAPHRPEVRILELNGRLQWLTVPRAWQYFPEKPVSNEERQYGFRRAITDSAPIISALQSRGQAVRFASPDNLPRYFEDRYQLVYDDQGYYLGRGDAVLIVQGV